MTIVITHELSQIEPHDLLKGGNVVEQGFRGDLEAELMDEEGGKGEFRRMMVSQDQGQMSKVVEEEEEEEEEEEVSELTVPPSLKHQSIALRPLTFGNWNWMFDAVAELTEPSPFDPPPPIPPNGGLSVPELAYLPSGTTTKKRDTLTSRLGRLVIPQTTTTRPALLSSSTLSTSTF